MIAKEGRVILIPLLLITFPVGLYAHSTDNQAMIVLYAVLGVLFLFCLNFFRDPKRTIPMDASLVLSPADGKVVKVTEVNDPEVGEGAKLVSIFLNVFPCLENTLISVYQVPHYYQHYQRVNKHLGKFSKLCNSLLLIFLPE